MSYSSRASNTVSYTYNTVLYIAGLRLGAILLQYSTQYSTVFPEYGINYSDAHTVQYDAVQYSTVLFRFYC